MAVVYFMVGISGCGKSTYADHFHRRSGINIVSSDTIRAELFGDENVQVNHALVFDTAHSRVIEHLKKGKDVVFDATNVTSWARRALLNKLPDGTKKVAVVFNMPPKVALRRQLNRERQVPKGIVERQWDQFCEDFDKIPLEFDDVISAW